MKNNFELYKETAINYLSRNLAWYKLDHLNEDDLNHVYQLASSVMMTRDGVLQGGSFVQAVIDNNLSEAVNRADDTAIQALRALVAVKRFCYTEQYES